MRTSRTWYAAGLVVALGTTIVIAFGIAALGLAALSPVASGLAEDDQTLDVLWLSAGFAGLFGLSAWAFERSDGARSPAAQPR